MTNNPLLSDAVVEAVARECSVDAFLIEGPHPIKDTYLQIARNHIEAAHKALTDAGFAVVPVEPTTRMCLIFHEAAWPTTVICDDEQIVDVRRGLRAALADTLPDALAAAQTGEVG